MTFTNSKMSLFVLGLVCDQYSGVCMYLLYLLTLKCLYLLQDLCVSSDLECVCRYDIYLQLNVSICYRFCV